MTTVYFIRHGETLWNNESKYQGHSDIALSEIGKNQAKKLSIFLINKKINIDVIVASDLSRALETAQILAKPYGIDVQVEQGFREINFGIWEGMTFNEIQAGYPDLASKWLATPEDLLIPNGESFNDVMTRATEILNKIVKNNDNKRIAIVSHGGTIRTLICALLDMPLSKMWQFKLDNTSLTAFKFYGDKPVLTLFNSTAHLD